jgi:hypothetical protein
MVSILQNLSEKRTADLQTILDAARDKMIEKFQILVPVGGGKDFSLSNLGKKNAARTAVDDIVAEAAQEIVEAKLVPEAVAAALLGLVKHEAKNTVEAEKRGFGNKPPAVHGK